jgi:hypothetical protein
MYLDLLEDTEVLAIPAMRELVLIPKQNKKYEYKK